MKLVKLYTVVEKEVFVYEDVKEIPVNYTLDIHPIKHTNEFIIDKDNVLKIKRLSIEKFVSNTQDMYGNYTKKVEYAAFDDKVKQLLYGVRDDKVERIELEVLDLKKHNCKLDKLIDNQAQEIIDLKNELKWEKETSAHYFSVINFYKSMSFFNKLLFLFGASK